MNSYTEYLQQRPYPGRGILLGCTEDQSCAIAAYFIMGRSEASRNRVFLPDHSGGGIRIAPHTHAENDPTGESLIFYTPAYRFQHNYIVANGDQSDTILTALQGGGNFHEAMLQRTYEPDAPHFTPRISGMLELPSQNANRLACQLAILYKARNSSECIRIFYQYHTIPRGTGFLLHTYAGEAENGALQPYSGAPASLRLSNASIAEFTDAFWQSLHAENRVALFVRYFPLGGGPERMEIRNRHSTERA